MWMHGNIKLKIEGLVYEPREDSFLIYDAIQSSKVAKMDVLEIGVGSGFLSIAASKKGWRITGVDINNDFVELAEKNALLNGIKIDVFKSDLFDKVKGKYDLIMFNAPYLPDSDGEKGSETWSDSGTISKFIDDSKNFLEKNGKVWMVFSSLSGLERIIERFEKNGFKVKIVSTKKIPWETLYLIEAII